MKHIDWVEEQIKQYVQQWVLIQMWFASQLCSWMDCRKMSKIVSLSFVNCSQDFVSGCTIKVIRASWRPMDCMEKQLRAFQGMLSRRLVVWPWYSSVVWHFFFNCCCPLRSVTATLLTWKIASSVCLSVTHQHLLSVHVIFRLREISLVVFSGKTYREDTAFWEVFSPDSLFFYLRDWCQL